MKRTTSRAGLIAIFALTVAVCSPVMAGPSDDWSVKPPPGWARLHVGEPGFPVGVQFLATWVHLGDKDFRQNINLVGENHHGKMKTYVSKMIADTRSHFATTKVLQEKPITICKNRPGRFLEFTRKNGDQTVIVEQVIAAGKTHGFVLTYTRLPTQPDLPAAEASLRSLCV